ncbi:MAG: hydroxymethylbilane synthase, partial [Candidatus Latescibacteria bacterium]|nr:hydroxymethylbilane synthase [Candidatus Latescibacterota bacterium]
MALKILRLGTRGSALAMRQTENVGRKLAEARPGLDISIVTIATEGDADQSSPLSFFGGRGAFVKSIEKALLRGEIDAAVHSLKDLP